MTDDSDLSIKHFLKIPFSIFTMNFLFFYPIEIIGLALKKEN